MKIGLIAAMDAEAVAALGRGRFDCSGHWPIRREVSKRGQVLCVRSGVGLERAEQAASWLAGHGLDLMVNLGVSGGLHADLKPGHAVVALACRRQGQDDTRVRGTDHGQKIRRILENLELPVAAGHLISVDEGVLHPEHKRDLHRQTGALAVDMESAAVANAAEKAGLPFVCVRAICDPWTRAVPPELAASMSLDGKVNPMALTRAIIRRPSLVPEMMRLGRDYKAALSCLARTWSVLERMFPRLR